MRRPGAIAILTVLATALAVQAQAPLAWKLNKGDQFYLRTVTTFKQLIKAGGKETRTDVEQTTVLGFKVEEKTAETLVLRESIEALSVKSGTNPPVTDDRFKDVAFTITLSPKMEILKFEGHEKLIDKLAGDDAAVRKSLQLVLGEDVLKKSVREAFAFLPDRPVKEGETWERTVETPLGPLGQLRLTNTYKLEGKDDVGGKKVDKITVSTAVDYRPTKPDKELPYHVVSGDLKAEDAKGTVHFDAASGRLVQSEQSMKLKGRMVLSLMGSNVDAEVQQEQITKVTLLNENPIKN